MNIVSVLIKLLPAIGNTVFGGMNVGEYIKRNKVVAILLLSLIIATVSFYYIYEQAFMHGGISKSKTEHIVMLKDENKVLREEIRLLRIPPSPAAPSLDQMVEALEKGEPLQHEEDIK